MELKVIRTSRLGMSFLCNAQAVAVTVALMFILAILFGASLSMGSYDLSLSKVAGLILAPDSSQSASILFDFRLPRTLVAILAGTLFALSGAILQGITRNPLADPSLIGISQGAALTVVIATMLFPEALIHWREVIAFAGSLGVAFLIQSLSGQSHNLKFILIGIGIAAFVSAVTSVFLTYGEVQSAMSALTWLAGSVHTASWGDVSLLVVVLALVLCASLYNGRRLDAILLGDEVAIGLGIAITKVQLVLLIVSVFGAALATAIVGPLGFVGLIASHLARGLSQSGSTNHLINSALVGALLVLVADLIGRTLFAPTQVAAGLVTSLIGAPLFAYLLIKKSKDN
ncbi:iron ABC transporter [Vibrio inusitatus NBRC 102082]|uniref:Iron ABC transporter n=1 Tax=Vibrio inusitatus NBRC 102082 TaxID=1219070 RepID=A0A4Y3HXT5_9VIBR|nr:iron ABC transporter permease [Vibrio inusitatus]GEA51989.1 iron ABC transporter [Vibrio inusitatus NBRC 102082]